MRGRIHDAVDLQQGGAMIVLDYETGCQMMDVCRAVDAATEIGDTIDEEHDTGDMI